MLTMLEVIRNRTRSVTRSDSGFTLIEVLVSILLLGVGIGGALTVFANADGTETVAHKSDTASQAARQVLDELRTRDYKSLAVRDPTGLGSTSGHPTLGNAPQNAGLPPATKTELQSLFARDRTVAPEGTTRLAGIQVGRDGETNLAEPLVDPSDTRQGDGKAIDSYRVVTVPDGAGNSARVHVLTRVSWRDVSCPILDLTNPLGQAKELLTKLGNLLRPSANGNSYSLYDLLLGSKGALTSMLTGQDQLVQRLLASISSAPSNTVLSTLLASLSQTTLSPVLALVGEAVKQVTGAVFSPVAALADPIGTLLASVVAPLAASLDPILNAITGPLSKLTDLCDLNLVDDGSGNGMIASLQTLLPGLSKLTTALTSLQGTLASKNLVGQLTDAASNLVAASNVSTGLPAPPSCPVLSLIDPCYTTWAAGNLVTTLVRGVTSIVQDTVGPILSTISTTLTSLPSTINAVVTTAGNLPQLLKAVSTTLSGAQSSMTLNGYKNTKRVTVAAWPEINGRLVGTPQHFEAIVTNPKAALLTADQAG